MTLDETVDSHVDICFKQKYAAAKETVSIAWKGVRVSLFRTASGLFLPNKDSYATKDTTSFSWRAALRSSLFGTVIGGVSSPVLHGALDALHDHRVDPSTLSSLSLDCVLGGMGGALLFGASVVAFHSYRTFFSHLEVLFAGEPIRTPAELDSYLQEEVSYLGLKDQHISVDLVCDKPSPSVAPYPRLGEIKNVGTNQWIIPLYRFVEDNGREYDGHRVGVLAHEVYHVKQGRSTVKHRLLQELFSEPAATLYQMGRVLYRLYDQKIKEMVSPSTR